MLIPCPPQGIRVYRGVDTEEPSGSGDASDPAQWKQEAVLQADQRAKPAGQQPSKVSRAASG